MTIAFFFFLTLAGHMHMSATIQKVKCCDDVVVVMEEWMVESDWTESDCLGMRHVYLQCFDVDARLVLVPACRVKFQASFSSIG